MRFSSAGGRIRLGQVMLTLTAAVLMFVALAFFRAPSVAPETERASLATPPVVVSEVGVQPFDLAVDVVGRVSPWREVELTAEVGGRITEVAVDIGDRVRAGQLVLRIETDDYETALREAEASELRAQARLEESEAALNRSEQLRVRGAISEREYEAALATKRAAEADLRGAEAGLERARRNLDDTRLTAPFSGTIVERHVDAGALVAGDRALVVLADLDTVAVEVGLTEREILLARGAESAIVTSRGGETVDGVVDGVAERADPATGTYLARIRVDNGDPRRFLGGMVVDVKIPYAALDAVPTVPAAALLETADGAHVFVVEHDTARRVDVEVVARTDDLVGISPVDGQKSVRTGDLVVIVGQSQLADGDAVQVVSQR